MQLVQEEALERNYNVTGPCDFYYQYKRIQQSGVTPPAWNRDGGAGGRKLDVIFRRPSPNSSDARITVEFGTPGSVLKLISNTYAGYSGPAPGDDSAVAEIHFDTSGYLVEFDPDDHLGVANVYTYRIRSESASNAADGILEGWVNGILRDKIESAYTSPYGIQEIQTMGKTWNEPTVDKDEGIYDILAWTEPF